MKLEVQYASKVKPKNPSQQEATNNAMLLQFKPIESRLDRLRRIVTSPIPTVIPSLVAEFHISLVCALDD